MTARKIVRGILFPRDQLLRVEELPVCASADLIDHCRLEVYEHAAWNMLACAGLRKECVEGVVATADGLIRWHLAIGLDAVLEAEQFPTRVADLHPSLTDVDADTLTHGFEDIVLRRGVRQANDQHKGSVT
jgi:hypothetical protein